MTDIRIDVEFYAHPKTKKLKRRLGNDGIIALQMLWMWCAKNRPNGDLSGLDDEDIELAADWEGEGGALVGTLADLRWLDRQNDGSYCLHDWRENNPWAAESDNRADKARLLRLARANPDAYAEYKDEGRTGISKEEYQDAITHVQENATARSTAHPDPDPDPKPTPTPNPPPPGGDDADDGAAPPNCPSTVQTVQPVDSPPGDHMPTAEACRMVQQCLAGKHGLTLSQMMVAKLSVMCSKHSRAEMLHAFDQAASAGATSINYLEAVLTGKRRQAQGKPQSKTEEAKGRLAAWMGDDWLRQEIAFGIMQLWADGDRSGRPASDVLVVAAANIEDELRAYQLTPEEVNRVRTAFAEVRRHCSGWPQAHMVCEFLPRRREQQALPEVTERGSPVALMAEFERMKKENNQQTGG